MEYKHLTKEQRYTIDELLQTPMSLREIGMLAEIEWKLNHRPRKSLGYRTALKYCKQLFNSDF